MNEFELGREGKGSVFAVKHTHWEGNISFSENGFFCKNGADYGKAILFSSGRLILQWYNWSEENCFLTEDGLIIGSNLFAKKINGPELWDILPIVEEEKLKVHFGCYNYKIDGWLNVDLPNFDLRNKLPFSNDSVSLIYLEHVIEHLTCHQIYNFLKEAKRVLKKGGIIRLAFPDIEKIALYDGEFPKDISKDQLVENNILLFGHKVVLSAKIVTLLLQNLGFQANTVSSNESAVDEMKSIVQHDKEIGKLLNEIESSYVEGKK